MEVTIRKFEEKDIPNKVEWINNPLNNQYLHYDLPLEIDKTLTWFNNNKDNKNRYDAVIEVDGKPVGVIGLLNIDHSIKSAEYYITLGDNNYKGKGVAFAASKLLIEYAFSKLFLNSIYLYTEYANIKAQKLFEKIGFTKNKLIKNDIIYNNKNIDRYFYTLNRSNYNDFYTPIYKLDNIYNNNVYIKRDDLFPFSFGGNKARKGLLFWNKIKEKKANYIVTYGSSSSNHCRIIANIAAAENIPCIIISPIEISKETYNKKLMSLFNAKIIYCKINDVHDTIENKLKELKNKGFNPYFIEGGGHGNIGTQAYVNCYNEICDYETQNNINFDYIFFASGTGGTQAGLVCGKILKEKNHKIVGISIARKKPRGSNIIKESIKDYLNNQCNDNIIEENVIFDDSYTGDGYGLSNKEIQNLINNVMIKYGVNLDQTYTGKAFYGMKEYLIKNNIENKNILFIHTGGTPLFFDDLNDRKEK